MVEKIIKMNQHKKEIIIYDFVIPIGILVVFIGIVIFVYYGFKKII